MKAQINVIKSLLVLLLAVNLNALSAQDKTASIKSAIESKRFVFKAQRVLPLSGRVRQINGENYEMRVLGDSLISYLPYFGRAYTAPLNANEGGIEFTSVKFDYSLKNGKKNSYQVLMTRDVADVSQVTLTVGEKGNASMQVLSNTRQTISFDGYIEPVKNL